MLFVYLFLLLVLGLANLVIGRRAARLARKYSQTARAADALLRESVLKGGNTRNPDPAQAAKRQYLVGQLVQKRDRLEARYHAWEGAAEKSRKAVTRVLHWKGRLLPYALGVVDLAGVLVLLDFLGVPGSVHVHDLVQQAASLLTR
jgi:hypothetical protein